MVSAHREENVDDEASFAAWSRCLNTLADRYRQAGDRDARIRARASGSRTTGVAASIRSVELLKPFGFLDYVELQMHARAVLSDSGTITEESSILNFPALNIREAHERPEGMEEGAVMMIGFSIDRVLQGLRSSTTSRAATQRCLRLVADYCDAERVRQGRADHPQLHRLRGRTVWKQY